jgi:hypothetical protein
MLVLCLDHGIQCLRYYQNNNQERVGTLYVT